MKDPGARMVDRATAYGQLGKLLLAAEAFAEAEPCFLNADALYRGDGRWTYYLAHVYRLQGESAKAASFFEQTLDRRPNDVAALFWLGNTYLEQGRLDEADAMFVKALAVRALAATRFGAGRVALARREYARAIEHLEAALALDQRATVIHYPLASAYRAIGRPEQADAHLHQRGDVEVQLPDPLMQEIGDVLHSEVVYERRGDRALARGEFAEAVGHFRNGLELAPSSLPIRQKLATALSLAGDVDGAVRQFNELLQRSPRFAPAHYSLGVLFLSSGQDGLAVERLAAATEYDPTYLAARLQLAHALRRRGQFQPSLRQYKEVIRRDPRVAEARFGEVLALVHLKEYVSARAELIEAVRLHPDTPPFIRTLARLYAAAPDARVRDGERAVMLAEELVRRRRTVDDLETMAMALAESGHYEAAVRWQGDALAAATQVGEHDREQSMAADLSLYKRHRPSRVPWREDPAWD